MEKIPWRRICQPTPIFLPGEFHEQRSLAAYGPQGCKNQTQLKQLSTSLYIYIYMCVFIYIYLYKQLSTSLYIYIYIYMSTPYVFSIQIMCGLCLLTWPYRASWDEKVHPQPSFAWSSFHISRLKKYWTTMAVSMALFIEELNKHLTYKVRGIRT